MKRCTHEKVCTLYGGARAVRFLRRAVCRKELLWKRNRQNKRTARARNLPAILPKARRTAKAASRLDFASREDPFGSYTGVCSDPADVPVQDADDL